MASLREKQREQRRRNILDAAWDLIGANGLDNTSIEEVAARAEVGPATVYNYFGSKNDLLFALLVRHVELEAEQAEASLEHPPEDMVDGMTALFQQYLLGLAKRCSPVLLREFYVMAMDKEHGYGRETYVLKQRFLDQALRLASFYKDRGQVREDVTAEEAALLCYSAVTLPFALFALGMGIDFDTARDQIRRYLSLMVSGVGSRAALPDEIHRNA